MTDSAYKHNIAQEIKDKTGFILEHDVATLLEANGWTVIHNRYYLDDMQMMQREIDLLVYKVDAIQDTLIYTTLIVSCKKSETKDWIFLTRDTIGTKSNLDTSPFTYWSNNEEINFQLKDKKFTQLPYCDNIRLAIINNFFNYSKTVFAFREYDHSQKNNKLSNDTGIYDSIITLIKSQSYELESLPLRRKDTICYYNINLLTVADVKRFIEVECSADQFEERDIEQINYVNRFLVNRREHNSRIVFTKYTNLPSVIINFDLLHLANCEIATKSIDTFYDVDIKIDSNARSLITSKFSNELSWNIKWAIYSECGVHDVKEIEFGFNKDSDLWEIMIEGTEEFRVFLNKHERTENVTKAWLKKYFRSTSSFIFTEPDLPF